MTHLLTRGEQQARKYPRPHIPAETFGEPVHKESNAPFWFGVAGVILGPLVVIVVGIIVAGA